MKQFVATHQKIISGVLFTLVIFGSLATLLAVSWPFLGLAAWKYVDGAPDTLNFTDYLIRFFSSLLSVVPYALVLGAISSLLYTFVVNDSENRTFLRIWSAFLFGVFILYMYPYIQVYFR